MSYQKRNSLKSSDSGSLTKVNSSYGSLGSTTPLMAPKGDEEPRTFFSKSSDDEIRIEMIKLEPITGPGIKVIEMYKTDVSQKKNPFFFIC